MNDKTKDRLIIILACIIAVLCMIIAFVLGMNFANNRNELKVNQDEGIKQDESNNLKDYGIEFTGDKKMEVTYNPSYAQEYNLNYKITDDKKLVFTDANNNNNSITYNSIKGNCKYITISIPKGKQLPEYHIAVITETGDVYYKMFIAWASLSEDNLPAKASVNDNFVKLENINNSRFNGIYVEPILDSNGNKSGFERLIISDEAGNKYFVIENENEFVLNEVK